MYTKVLLILATIAIGFDTFQSQMVEVEINYDSYRPIVNELTNFGYKLRVLQAIWAETLFKYSFDKYKTQALYIQLSIVIKNKGRVSASLLHVATDLQQEIGQFVVNQSSLHVAKVLNAPEYPIEENLYFIVLPFLDTDLKLSIYESAIDKVYNFQQPQTLAAHFEYLREKITLARLEDVTRAQLYLYWKFLGRGEINDEYLLNVGYYFLMIKSSSDYDKLSYGAKASLDSAISKLPSSLQYFYYKPKFCLLNKEYSEFIYTTNHIAIDRFNAHVFTWDVQFSVGDNGHWVKEITKLEDDGLPRLKMQIALKSILLKNYTYRATIGNWTNILASKDDQSVPPNSGFSVEFQDNTLIFRQDGFIVCAHDVLHSENRRLVYAYKDKAHTSSTPSCQWIARECP